MPLWLAFVFALVISMGMSVLLADVNLGSLPFTNGNVSTIFALFVIPPGLAAPVLARYKRRGIIKWTAIGFGAIVLSPVLSFLPMTILLALGLANRVPYRVPEAELEGQEHPRAMRQLVALREELWKLDQQVEDRYMHRDFTGLARFADVVDPFDPRLDGIREQRSKRGQEIRMRLKASIQELRIVTQEAEAVLAQTAQAPELVALAAQGSAMPAKTKPAKALAKHMRRIEQMLNGARIQIAVAGGMLEALGYSANDPAATDSGLPEPPDAESEAAAPVGALPLPPTANRPRPRRPVRRRRF
jgi:hypothetical protein